MKAEIIAVGTELLMGQILNSNAQFLARECSGLGINVYFQTVVGDNKARLKQALEIARSRADLILCTGGLGPTQDDLTRDVLADFVGLPLVMHAPSLAGIEHYFRTRGVPILDSNRRQALTIEGGVPLINETGMAVGTAVTRDGTHYILLPGPPREMKPMFVRHAVPWLRSVMGDEMPLYSKILKFAGIGESGLENALIDLIDHQTDPSIATYAKEGEVAVRLTTRAASDGEADAKLRRTMDAIAGKVGRFMYADADLPLEQTVVELLAAQGRTLAAAESCTGGMFSEMITSIPGSSRAFKGGLVCYSNEFKQRWLGVPHDVLEGDDAPGAVSEQAAALMAEGLLRSADTDFAVAITGVAGPAHSERKPVGLVYIALAERGKPVYTEKLDLNGSREMIRLKSVRRILFRLWQRLKG